MKFQNTLIVGVMLLIGAVAVGERVHDTVWPEPIEDRSPRFEGGQPAEMRAEGASLASSVAEECKGQEEDQKCLEKAVLAIVADYGPVESISAMNALVKDKVMKGRADYHDFVHKIGRATAKKEGLNPDAFFLCPSDYNYGCQHGFFEQALVVEPNAKKAAETVCDVSRMADKPMKFLFYCYHGVGHGIMMARAYKLQDSLDLCDSFAGSSEIEGCYQGVFMENVVGVNNSAARSENYSETDWLVPCNKVDMKYRYQCYMNMGGYLATKAGSGKGAVERATKACLNADKAHVEVCMQSIGLLATNPDWQWSLAPEYTDDFIANAVSICEHFPAGYPQHCVLAAIDNLANFDVSDTTRMVAFCNAVDDRYKEWCFARIGPDVQNEMPAGATDDQLCHGVPDEYRAVCVAAIRR